MTDTETTQPEPKPTLLTDVRETRGLEFVLGMILMLEGVLTPALAVPLSQAGVFLLIVTGLTRPSRLKFVRWRWVFPLFCLLLLYVAMVSIESQAGGGSDWSRRLIRLIGIALLTWVIATGRVNFPSIIKGLAFALALNAILFLAHVAPDTYGGALSGYIGDKNKAGLYYAVAGLLVLQVLRSRSGRILWTLIIAGLLWLTESRTSITALTAGVLWAWLAARRFAPLRWIAATGLWFGVGYLEDNFAQAGVFENRWGSDLLRGRIDAASLEKLEAAPWWGLGLGQAFVVIAGDTWYFHNSYWSLLVEGGWPYLVGVVTITVLVGLRPFGPGERTYSGMLVQGATVCILICALRLGEVFLTIPWALTIGAALNQGLAQKTADLAEAAPSTPHASEVRHGY